MARAPVALLTASPLMLALRQARVRAAQARRLAAWVASPERWPAPVVAAGGGAAFVHRVHARSVLMYQVAPELDPVLEAGKRRNVSLAAPAFDGVEVSAARPLSFWRTLGRVRAAAGYAVGRELAGGCVVPALGGGLCLLSNAIFALAALSGWRVLERHAHSRGVGRSAEDEAGLDATVYWPQLDLVVAPRQGSARLVCRADGDRLRLEAWSDVPADRVTLRAEVLGEVEGPEGRLRHGRLRRTVVDAAGRVVVEEEDLGAFRQRLEAPPVVERSCFTCGETECHARARHLAGPRA